MYGSKLQISFEIILFERTKLCIKFRHSKELQFLCVNYTYLLHDLRIFNINESAEFHSIQSLVLYSLKIRKMYREDLFHVADPPHSDQILHIFVRFECDI